MAEMENIINRESLEFIGGAYLGMIAVKSVPSNLIGLNMLGNFKNLAIGIIELVVAYILKSHKSVMRILVGAGLFTSINGIFDIAYPQLAIL